jgi:hypothetical protein
MRDLIYLASGRICLADIGYVQFKITWNKKIDRKSR